MCRHDGIPGNHLIAVPMKAGGSAGPGMHLSTSLDIYQPGGMRLSQGGRILMVEGRGKDGNRRLDEVTVSGNNATLGSTAYVLEAKLNYQRDPALKGKDPGTFTAYAVPLR